MQRDDHDDHERERPATRRTPPHAPELGRFRPLSERLAARGASEPPVQPLQPLGPLPKRRAAPSQRPRSRSDDDGPSLGRRLVRIALILGGVVVGLVALAATALYILSPIDRARETIQAEFKARTGRDMVIAGPTSLSFWPDPTLTLDKVSISAPPGWQGPPTIALDRLEARLAFWPLLSQTIKVERFALIRPVITLEVDAQGRRSWDLAETMSDVRYAQAASGPARTDARPEPASPATRALSSRLAGLSVNELKIVDGTVRYRDARARVAEDVTGITSKATLASLAAPLDAAGTLVWRGEQVAYNGRVTPFAAVLDDKPATLDVAISGQRLAASYDGGLMVRGEPQLDGKMVVKAPSIAALGTWVGARLPELAGGLSLTARVKSTPARVALSDAVGQIGAIAANGALTVDTSGARPHVKGTLAFADLDLNTLAAAAPTAAQRAAAPAPSTAPPPPARAPKSIEELLARPGPAKPEVRGFARRSGWSDETIDAAALGLVDADLRVTFNRLLWRAAKAGQGQIGILLKGGALKATIDDLQLYDGRVRGLVTADAATGALALGANLTLDGVDLQPLLTEAAEFDWLAGKGRIALALAGRGTSERQMIETLNGKADIVVGKGQLLGLDLAQMVGGIGQGRLPSMDRRPGLKTDFSELAGSVTILNGVAQNQDFRAKSAAVSVAGAGTIGLAARTLDYTAKVKLATAAPAGAGGPGGLIALDVPLRITGGWDKPNVGIDGQAVLKNPQNVIDAAREFGKSEKGRELQDAVRGALGGDPEAKAKARDLLRQFVPRQ
jgi:AsmA protein